MVYPADLRRVDFAQLHDRLASAELFVAVVTEADVSGYVATNVDGLAEILRGTFDQLVKENAVAEAVAVLEAGIETFASAVCTAPGIVPRLADVLGVRELPDPKKAPADEEEEEDQ